MLSRAGIPLPLVEGEIERGLPGFALKLLVCAEKLAEYKRRSDSHGSPVSVIPALAGIQSAVGAQHTKPMMNASHVFSLDPGMRRDDDLSDRLQGR